jgi:DNA-binding GntR family transcriptional regulator
MRLADSLHPKSSLPADKGDATDRITAAITHGILSGAFVPGQHLLESNLSRQLSVSRSSLREAMKRLAAENIVTLTQYRGAFVDILDRQATLDLLHISELLACLGARSAAIACKDVTNKAVMSRAANNLKEQTSQLGFLESWRGVYAAAFELNANRELAKIFPISRSDLVRAQIARHQSLEQRDLLARGLLDVAHAIIGEKPDAAEGAMRAHFALARHAVDQLPTSAFG